ARLRAAARCAHPGSPGNGIRASAGADERDGLAVSHLRRFVALGALAPLLVAAGCGSAARLEQPAAALAHHEHQPPAHRPKRVDPVEFRQDMRKLWEDHITWTRLFIVSAVAGLPDVDPTAGRLLQNQADIGAAIVPFYGEDAGAALTKLLRE